MQIEYFALFKEHLKDEKLFVSQNKIEMCHLIHIVAGRGNLPTHEPLCPSIRRLIVRVGGLSLTEKLYFIDPIGALILLLSSFALS